MADDDDRRGLELDGFDEPGQVTSARARFLERMTIQRSRSLRLSGALHRVLLAVFEYTTARRKAFDRVTLGQFGRSADVADRRNLTRYLITLEGHALVVYRAGRGQRNASLIGVVCEETLAVVARLEAFPGGRRTIDARAVDGGAKVVGATTFRPPEKVVRTTPERWSEPPLKGGKSGSPPYTERAGNPPIHGSTRARARETDARQFWPHAVAGDAASAAGESVGPVADADAEDWQQIALLPDGDRQAVLDLARELLAPQLRDMPPSSRMFRAHVLLAWRQLSAPPDADHGG